MKNKKVICHMKKVISGALMAAMLLMGVKGVDTYASEQKDWYVYYNDSHTNSPEWINTFGKYTNWNYTAVHTSRSHNSVVTLIQPVGGTSFQYPSYVVDSSKIKFYVSAASGSYVYVKSKLSYNTAPASTSGVVVRPDTAN